MHSETKLSDLFWAASGSETLPAAKPAAKSSCCGPKPAATEPSEAVQAAAAPKASSCCGPKPAAEVGAATTAETKAKSSCCG